MASAGRREFDDRSYGLSGGSARSVHRVARRDSDPVGQGQGPESLVPARSPPASAVTTYIGRSSAPVNGPRPVTGRRLLSGI